MFCPRCKSSKIEISDWKSNQNWKTAVCLDCGFRWDFDSWLLHPEEWIKYLESLGVKN